MPVGSTSALIGVLCLRVGNDVVTNIENRIINRVIDTVYKEQMPALTRLELTVGELQRGQIREVEAGYKSGIAFLDDSRRTYKRKQKIEFVNDARKAFTHARFAYEVGEMAAKSALFVGACHHLLYCIDDRNGTANEERWYEDAFRLADQSRGPDGKPPLELIKELLQLPSVARAHGTFENYRSRWETKLIATRPSPYKTCIGCGQRFIPRFGEQQRLYCYSFLCSCKKVIEEYLNKI
jgi:hypothetical protein